MAKDNLIKEEPFITQKMGCQVCLRKILNVLTQIVDIFFGQKITHMMEDDMDHGR